jgi:pyruvate dehydrogenase E2 component (dihydrolipoamide acetyltransferase)
MPSDATRGPSIVYQVVLPKFDANVLEATLGPWHKSEGDRVEKGDVLVDVVTDKANFELEAEVSGTLRRILAPEKSEVPLGYVVALIGEPGEPLIDVSTENERMMREYLASATMGTVPISGRKEIGTVPVRVRATPRARRLAHERGIDLAALAKSLGVEIVTEEHVLKFKTQNPKLK